MANVANLVRWEWFKLSRRWMPWILLGVVLLSTQLILWASVAGFKNAEQQTGPSIGLEEGRRFGAQNGISVDCAQIASATPGDVPPGLPVYLESLQQACAQWQLAHQEQLAQFRNNFTVPGVFITALTTAQGIGGVLVAILMASVLGSEYGWGTLRSVLSRGTGRWQLLAAKFALVLALTAAALIVVMTAAAVSSILASRAAGAGSPGTVTASDAAIAFGRMWLALVPYVALAGCIAAVFGSAVAGIGFSLAYQLAEQIGVAILINLVDWFHNVADYMLIRNVSAWVQGSALEGQRGMITGTIGALPGQGHAVIVLLGYTIVLGVLAFWLFQRRDVKGASGG